MQYFKLLRPATNPSGKTLCVYEEYPLSDPTGGDPVDYKRIVGYFTLEELQAYGVALQAIIAQAAIPPSP